MTQRPLTEDTPYKEVRGLARGLDVLRALNTEPGGLASTSRLARLCGLDRTTTKRLLETLRSLGLVRTGEREGQYCLTFQVRRLAEGYRDEAWIEHVALPRMRASVPRLLWPCDLATPEAGFMIVRETTHRWSRLSQHRAMLGERLPMLHTAMGRAYLAACTADDRQALLQLLAQRQDAWGEAARDEAWVAHMLAQTQARGFATNEGEWHAQAHYAAIGVPLWAGERLLGAMNMVYPHGALSGTDLVSQWVPRLRALADEIGAAVQPWLDLPA